MSLTVILPVYNESESLSSLLEQLFSVLRKLQKKTEVICVDDGSKDGSAEVLAKVAKKNWLPWTADVDMTLKLIQFRRNFGKAAALQAGFDAAEGDIIVTMDADLQDDPTEIPRLLEKLEEGYDMVSGWKQKRKDPLSKTLPSRLFNFFTALFTGIPLHDFNCGFKAYRKEVIDSLHLYGELHRYIPVLAHQQGFQVGELAVRHHPRKFGKSKYGLKRLLRGGLDLLTVLFLTRYLRRPLHLFGTTGLFLGLIGFCINGYLTVLRFQTGSIQGHYPLLMLGVLLMVLGFQSLTMGLLGEMLSRHEAKEEPVYSIARIWKIENDFIKGESLTSFAGKLKGGDICIEE